MMRCLALIILFTVTSLARAHEGDLIKTGEKAPLFSGTDIEGKPVSLESLKGKVVLINFFATWCPPCRVELPEIQAQIWEVHRKEGLVILAIAREEDTATVTKFNHRRKFGFTMMADPEREIYNKYATEYIPRCYLVGRDGVVKYTNMEFSDKDFNAMKVAVAAELAGKTK